MFSDFIYFLMYVSTYIESFDDFNKRRIRDGYKIILMKAYSFSYRNNVFDSSCELLTLTLSKTLFLRITD